MTKELELQALVENLRKIQNNSTMENELLERKMIRQLYKILGSPKEEDFKDEFETAGRYWKKHNGYTTYICSLTKEQIEIANNTPTSFRITRPSKTKMEIVKEYERHGWSCEVQSYNVICKKFVKHPKHENIWVCFYSSRDCRKYEYVIEEK